MYLWIVVIIVFAGCFATLFQNGLWSNTLTLVNMILAGLLAMNFFEPLATLLDTKVSSSYTYVWDFLSIWLIFILAMAGLRAVTDYVSQVKVRFPDPVDKGGGMLMAAWVGWLMVCFTMATLHLAPLARNALGGAFQPDPDSKMIASFAPPDRVWLGWVRRESLGALSHFGEASPFDPQGDFILRYGTRRAEFENQLSLGKARPPARLEEVAHTRACAQSSGWPAGKRAPERYFVSPVLGKRPQKRLL